MTELLDEIHPGEILLEEYMRPIGLSVNDLADAIGVPRDEITGIVQLQRGISAETALRLGLYFQMDPHSWINLQTEYDLRIAKRQMTPEAAARIHPLDLRAA